jgi:glycosyltransferase involved in cell wall biosynthesis
MRKRSLQGVLEPRKVMDILVPRLIDAANRNAQNLNARAMLSHFTSPGVVWHTFHYGAPDSAVAARPNVRVHSLARGRLWTWHALLKYQGAFDAVFYPGNEIFDARALRLRKRLGRRAPIVATLEGIPGDAAREAQLSGILGRPVHCFRPRSGERWIESHDAVRRHADHTIAISEHLGRVGRHLYGGSYSVLPMGVDTATFHALGRTTPERPVVLGAGTLYAGKRPEVFVQLASRFPGVRFKWIGEGPLRKALSAEVSALGLSNLDFPGEMAPAALAEEFRKASLFVLPSLSEGVPKVTQEAAACGLPVILFGFYEAPSVADGVNGHVVWDDEGLMDRVGNLAAQSARCAEMGSHGARMARAWSWAEVAPQWEAEILDSVRR